MNYFAVNLRYLRLKNNITQVELAKRIKRSHRGIQEIEGGRRNPGVDFLIAICKIFRVSETDMLHKDLSIEE